MQAIMVKAVAALAFMLATQLSWAIDIDSAKSQGLVGEANTGYLAAVTDTPSADVKALIAEVNRKRKAEFESTAAKTGATLDQVRVRFYQLAVQRTAPGHYYQDPGGRWVRK
jgi:uncharacterized protein YdbL (DUF1318 family)